MTNLKKVWNLFIDTGLDNAATTLINPIALGAGVTLPVDHFQNKGRQCFGSSIKPNHLAPIRTVPPECTGIL